MWKETGYNKKTKFLKRAVYYLVVRALKKFKFRREAWKVILKFKGLEEQKRKCLNKDTNKVKGQIMLISDIYGNRVPV